MENLWEERKVMSAEEKIFWTNVFNSHPRNFSSKNKTDIISMLGGGFTVATMTMTFDSLGNFSSSAETLREMLDSAIDGWNEFKRSINVGKKSRNLVSALFAKMRQLDTITPADEDDD